MKSPEDLEIKLITAVEQIENLAPLWDALLERSPVNRVFGSSQWYLAALVAYPQRKPLLTAAFRNDALVGVFPLIKRPPSVGAFATGMSDYNDIITAYGDSDTARRLLHFVLNGPMALDTLVLENLRDDSVCLQAAREMFPQAKPFGARYCLFAYLSDGYDAYMANLSKRFRSNMRRIERNAERDGIEIVRLSAETTPPATLPKLFLDLHLARHSETSCFRRAYAQTFVTRSLPPLFESSKIKVFALRHEGRIIALRLFLNAQDSLCAWNGGFLPEFAASSPGNLITGAVIRHLAATDIREFDMMRGEEPYKLPIATGRRRITTLELPL
ncbi:MAG: GNAT family N-acetyltransferase [Acidobacteriota bacterium]|nr:GNAT family N-acetyltransferase [Acidobacteriota bacterium]